MKQPISNSHLHFLSTKDTPRQIGVTIEDGIKNSLINAMANRLKYLCFTPHVSFSEMHRKGEVKRGNDTMHTDICDFIKAKEAILKLYKEGNCKKLLSVYEQDKFIENYCLAMEEALTDKDMVKTYTVIAHIDLPIYFLKDYDTCEKLTTWRKNAEKV